MGQNDLANLNFSICIAETTYDHYQPQGPIISTSHLQLNSTRGQRIIKMLRQGERLLQPHHGLLGASVKFPLPVLGATG
jgi:hypothetical protein